MEHFYKGYNIDQINGFSPEKLDEFLSKIKYIEDLLVLMKNSQRLQYAAPLIVKMLVSKNIMIVSPRLISIFTYVTSLKSILINIENYSDLKFLRYMPRLRGFCLWLSKPTKNLSTVIDYVYLSMMNLDKYNKNSSLYKQLDLRIFSKFIGPDNNITDPDKNTVFIVQDGAFYYFYPSESKEKNKRKTKLSKSDSLIESPNSENLNPIDMRNSLAYLSMLYTPLNLYNQIDEEDENIEYSDDVIIIRNTVSFFLDQIIDLISQKLHLNLTSTFPLLREGIVYYKVIYLLIDQYLKLSSNQKFSPSSKKNKQNSIPLEKRMWQNPYIKNFVKTISNGTIIQPFKFSTLLNLIRIDGTFCSTEEIIIFDLPKVPYGLSIQHLTEEYKKISELLSTSSLTKFNKI